MDQRLQLDSWSVHILSCGRHPQWAGACRRQPISDSPLIINVSFDLLPLSKSIKKFFKIKEHR